VTVGIIGKVDGNTISIQTLEGVIPVHLTVDSVIQEFANSSPRDLAVGQRVTVMGREDESGFSARAVIVTLDSTSLFQDEGDFQIGRAGRALVGTIEKIDADSITVNTKLGPRTATIVAGETAFKTPAAVAAAQLSAGQLVTVTGSESPAGGIIAQSVLITPELGELMSAGRQGGRGGRSGGGGGERRGQDSTPSSETPVASPILDTERKTGTYDGITFVVTEKSMATFRVREQLALIPLPHRAEMRTTALSGEIHFDGRPSAVVIDLHQLSSGQRLRDGYVRRAMFPDHPEATFTLEDVANLPSGFAEGEESKSRIDGVLNIRGADFPLKFNITAQDNGDAITIVGRTRFSWDELGISPPTAGLVLSLSDEVEVRIRLTVKPVR
jgi:polyisoprenoid-binding protein YceI